MKMGIRRRRDVWRFSAIITLFAIAVSELCIGTLYLAGGESVFNLRNVMIMAAFLPTIIAWPVTFHISQMSLQLTKAKAELQELAHTDPLTQLPNRRAFFKAAEAVLQADAAVATLLVIDADHFKDLNDTYGHAMGDKALIAIADILRANFRQDDLVCRTGGEEFAVLVPNMNVAQAEILASRVVAKVAANPLVEPGVVVEYSVSCGVADTTHAADLHGLFKSADDAMYMAKQQGRNRVVRLPHAA